MNCPKCGKHLVKGLWTEGKYRCMNCRIFWFIKEEGKY